MEIAEGIQQVDGVNVNALLSQLSRNHQGFFLTSQAHSLMKELKVKLAKIKLALRAHCIVIE